MSNNNSPSILEMLQPWFEESEYHTVIGISLTDVLLRGYTEALTKEQRSILLRMRTE
jgi:hypothetical protein